MEFTAKDVAKLREMTGAGMMDCKKALTHAEGDMDKAVEFLREQGMSSAAKKASRIASEGAVSAFVSKDSRTGAMIELNCESDFVSKGPDFQALAQKLAEQCAESGIEDVEKLVAYQSKNGETIESMINNATAKIGEKISLRRCVINAISGTGRVESYIHLGGKIGVLLRVDTEKDINKEEIFSSMCHDIALHIAALSPIYIHAAEVSKEKLEQEREIAKAQIMNDPKNANKPQQILDKMIEGRLQKYFFKENCLAEQDFVKDPSMTVSQLTAEVSKKTGCKIELKSFVRYVMGEGLEKKQDNLAEEIAKLQA